MGREHRICAATFVAALGTLALRTSAAAVESSAAVPPAVEGYAMYVGNTQRIEVFEGDFTGDGAADAIAFIYHAAVGGNAVYLDVSLFESIDGGLVHKRALHDVFGSSPRDVAISPGLIEFTTTVLKAGEPRCCPTGEAQYTVRP